MKSYALIAGALEQTELMNVTQAAQPSPQSLHLMSMFCMSPSLLSDRYSSKQRFKYDGDPEHAVIQCAL